MKTSVSVCVVVIALSMVNAEVHSKGAYTLKIPVTFELSPVPKSDDPWITSLVSNLARRAGGDQLAYSVWRRTNIVGTYNGEASSVSVYARDGEDSRFWFGRLHVSPIMDDDPGWSHGITEWF